MKIIETLLVVFIIFVLAVGVGLIIRHSPARSGPLEATWVSEAHDGGVSKSGRVWRQEEWTAAMKGTSELGKWKRVTLVEGSRPVYVLVTDRLPDKAQSDIDLSKGAALLLGGTDLLRRGKFEVNVEDAP